MEIIGFFLFVFFRVALWCSSFPAPKWSAIGRVLKGWNSRPKEFCFGKTGTDNMDYPQVWQFHQIPKGFRNQRMLLICKQKPNRPVATSPNIIPHPNTSSLEPKLRFINHQQQSNATHPCELMKIFPPRNGKSSSGPQKVSLVTSKFSPLRRAPALVLLFWSPNTSKHPSPKDRWFWTMFPDFPSASKPVSLKWSWSCSSM